MSEHNKAIVRRLFAELWNTGNLAVASVQTPAGVVCYDGAAQIAGVPGSAAT